MEYKDNALWCEESVKKVYCDDGVSWTLSKRNSHRLVHLKQMTLIMYQLQFYKVTKK